MNKNFNGRAITFVFGFMLILLTRANLPDGHRPVSAHDALTITTPEAAPTTAQLSTPNPSPYSTPAESFGVALAGYFAGAGLVVLFVIVVIATLFFGRRSR